MKNSTIILFLFLGPAVLGQRYTFTDDFVPGTIVLNDTTERSGYIECSIFRNEELKFKSTFSSEIEKFGPDDILGFKIDSMEFRSLFDLNTVSVNYATIGRKTKLIRTFGEIVSHGKYEIYKIYVPDYDPVSGSAISTLNFMFKKDNTHVCYPYGLRMRQKKYDKAKVDLIDFFEGHQQLVQMIKDYDRTQSFDPIVNQIRTLE